MLFADGIDGVQNTTHHNTSQIQKQDDIQNIGRDDQVKELEPSLEITSSQLQPTHLKITTLNLNGVRSAFRKGFSEWLHIHQPDVLLLQEVRAPPMPELFAPLYPHCAWFSAQKAGYSGVALLAKYPLFDVRQGMNHVDMDHEGRVLSALVQGVRFVSVYLPSGSSRPERQALKEDILPRYQQWIDALREEGSAIVIGGDYNLAHQNIDLKNWRANQKNPGFLPQEREWMTSHLASGLIDNHREMLGERSAYTWWSQRGNAYANDTGWRIDYLLSAGIKLHEVSADRSARVSDHAPLSGQLVLPEVCERRII